MHDIKTMYVLLMSVAFNNQTVTFENVMCNLSNDLNKHSIITSVSYTVCDPAKASFPPGTMSTCQCRHECSSNFLDLATAGDDQ